MVDFDSGAGGCSVGGGLGLPTLRQVGRESSLLTRVWVGYNVEAWSGFANVLTIGPLVSVLKLIWVCYFSWFEVPNVETSGSGGFHC